MKLFGERKKAPSNPSPQASIAKLRETLAMLEKREEFLEKKVEREVANARKYAAKNKRAALMCLKRKKGYEAQIERLSGAKLTIEQQLMAIEGAHVSLETMKAMRIGAKTMERIHGSLDIDDVDDTMDEIREQMDIAAEIGDAISSSIGGDLIDDDDLEAELDGLEQELLDEQFLPSVLSGIPNAPTTAPVSEEDELKALERSMAFG